MKNFIFFSLIIFLTILNVQNIFGQECRNIQPSLGGLGVDVKIDNIEKTPTINLIKFMNPAKSHFQFFVGGGFSLNENNQKNIKSGFLVSTSSSDGGYTEKTHSSSSQKTRGWKHNKIGILVGANTNYNFNDINYNLCLAIGSHSNHLFAEIPTNKLNNLSPTNISVGIRIGKFIY